MATGVMEAGHHPSAPRFATRFAPSPTGRLHLGHAYSAILGFEAARDRGGRFLLRIEDTDLARRRPEYEAAIYEDLAWLGLEWERPVRRQSAHLERYRAAIDRLAAQDLAYRCFLSRKEVLEAIETEGRGALDGPDGPVFFGGPLAPEEEAARLARGEAFSWRLSIAACRAALGAEADALTFNEAGEGPAGERGLVRADIALLGDAIIGRKDTGVSYHLAAVLDDADQGITDVVRGADVFPSTHLHRLLQRLLGLPTPVYRHHRLILRPDGKRFSKSDTSVTLAEMRAKGATPAEIRARLGLPTAA